MRVPEYFGSMPPADVLLGAVCNPKIAFLFEPITKAGAEGCTDDSLQEGRKRQALAVEICRRCPVKDRCFEDAVMHARVGVYGGVPMTPRWHRDRRSKGPDMPTPETDAERTDQLPVTKDALKHIPEHKQPPPSSPVAPDPKMFRERRGKRP